MFELEPEQIFKLIHGFEVKPAYLPHFAMDVDPIILETELILTKTALVDSPNFPNAGKGLVNIGSTVDQGVYIPYWGKIFLHTEPGDVKLHSVDLDEKFKCRFITPLFQPFLSQHMKLYLAGSLSCVATYINDATYEGFDPNIRNNCLFEQRLFTGYTGIELQVNAFADWIKDPFHALFAENANSTFWTVPTTPIDLYSPSPILPLIPHDLARSIMLSRYSEALQSNIDVWIAQCEETRVYMNTRAVFSNVPTPRFTVIGDDYLIGFIAVNNGSLNVINICSVLPLHNSGNYNLTNVLTLFRIQYDPCIVLTDELSEYWRSVFHAYRLFKL